MSRSKRTLLKTTRRTMRSRYSAKLHARKVATARQRPYTRGRL